MTTCPSGVDYRRLVDHARVLFETRYRRPLPDRLLRAALALAAALARRLRRRLAARGARRGRFAPLIARAAARRAATRGDADAGAQRACRRAGGGARPEMSRAAAKRQQRRRVALLTGCAQAVLAPQINAATIAPAQPRRRRRRPRRGRRLLRLAAASHGPRAARARPDARQYRRLDARDRRRRAWRRSSSPRRAAARRSRTMARCSPTIPLTPTRRRGSRRWRATPANMSPGLDLPFAAPRPLVVAYHAACSLQHGQKIIEPPKALLRRAGFSVRSPAEAHLCCGSAGTYNILQPAMAAALRARKVANLERLKAGRHRRRQYRLPDADRRARAHCRSSTRSSCSTGQAAARRRWG